MKKHTVILLFILISLSEGLFGQNNTGYLQGFLFTNRIYENKEQSTNGAAVQLILAQDTLYTVAFNGMFLFDKIPLGKAKITISHLNFKTNVTDVEILKKTVLEIFMEEKENKLKEVTVMGRVPMIIMSGDTMKFNAAAVKLLEGDVALEILKQVPGVEISDAGIKVLGQNIAKTYVNNRMIFGRNNMSALENIPATEVVSINTYEEHADPNPETRRKGDKKVRVLDIKTRTPIISAITAHALASFGHDFEKSGRNRYGAGITANFFSEKLLLSANAFSNNVNRRSNRLTDIISTRTPAGVYNKNDYIDFGIVKNWGKALFLDNIGLEAGYTYSRAYSQTGKMQQEIYFPNTQYLSREYSDSSTNDGTNSSHNATLNLHVVKTKLGTLDFINSFQKLDNSHISSRSGMSSLNGDVIRNTSKSNSEQDGYKLRHGLKFSSRQERINYSIGANYERSDYEGQGYRIDSLSSTGLNKTLESGPVGLSNTFGITGSMRYNISKETLNDLYIEYSFNYDNISRKRFVTNITDISRQFTDSINTYNYTNNYNTHRGTLGLNRLFPGKIRVDLSLTLKTSATNRDEVFPEIQNYNRRQNALLPAVTIQKQFEGFDNFQITYKTLTILPSLEQWRDRLDNTNPYRLFAGNPNLKQSYVHNIALNGYTVGKNSRMITYDCNLEFTHNTIAYKTRYFTQRTPLHEWGDYIAESQSTLTKYENLNGMVKSSIGLGFSQPLQTINCTVGLSAGFSYGKSPSYIKEQLIMTNNYTPSLGLSLQSNFSRTFRLKARTNSRYYYSINSIRQNNRTLEINGNVTTEWQLLKRLYLNTSYDLAFYKSFSSQFQNITQHILNAVVGFKLLKGKMDLSLSAYDILNRNTGFKTAMMSDYIRNSWERSFGRYFSFNIAYRFYKSKSGLKKPDSIDLQSGGMRELK